MVSLKCKVSVWLQLMIGYFKVIVNGVNRNQARLVKYQEFALVYLDRKHYDAAVSPDTIPETSYISLMNNNGICVHRGLAKWLKRCD